MSQSDTQTDTRNNVKSPSSIQQGLKITLVGNTIGRKQQDLNSKVNDAAAKNIPLEQDDDDGDCSDANKLFKIGLASKYKNVDYIMKILKSGDGFHISKAIKCQWLYDDEYQEFINPNYLRHNVFAFMAPKTRRKFLIMITKYVRNETRAIDFYEYCMAENLRGFAFKFLIYTPYEFKTNMIKDKFSILMSVVDGYNIKLFIGNNFSLAELYQDEVLKNTHYFKSRTAMCTWSSFRYLYWVNAEKYLNKWEYYFDHECNIGRWGLRMSKDLMLNHKVRIKNNVLLYYKSVNTSIFCKYITKEDAKQYLTDLLPESPEDFWNKYKTEYMPLINIIPTEEKFGYIKDIFKTKYPGEEFEMSENFYSLTYYELMTVKEREDWALRHLANPNKSFLSQDEDKEYQWYRFVDFDDALPAIKKYILICTEQHKRAELTNILIESTRNQDQVKNLLEYYCDRHINEGEHTKRAFIRNIIDSYAVWEFSENCWKPFNKLLCSIHGYYDHCFVPVFLYYFLNKKEFLEDLEKNYIAPGKIIDFDWTYTWSKYLKRINNLEQQEQIYQYLKRFCIDELKSWPDSWIEDVDFERKNKRRGLIYFVKCLLSFYKKPLDDLPKTVLKYLEDDNNLSLSQNELIKPLKEDAKSVLSKISLLKNILDNYERIDRFLNMLNNHFRDDLRQDFLNYFLNIVEGPLIDCGSIEYNAAVQGLFILADESFKNEFVIKHEPKNPKIPHDQIDTKLLHIQKAICSFACYSRPPVPLEYICKYITGDYLKFCLPMFGYYAANLRPQDYEQFVNALLDTPVSVQKHGLRAAIQTFSIDTLVSLVLNVWKRSKNISLRLVIYTRLFERMQEKKDENQSEIFKTLLIFTSDLNKDDDERTLDTVISHTRNRYSLPEHFRDKFIEIAWTTFNKFPDQKKYIKLKSLVIYYIKQDVEFLHCSVVRKVVDEYLDDIFIKKHIVPSEDRNKLKDLYLNKLNLTAAYIVVFRDEEHIKELVHFILNKCFEMWNDYYKPNNEADVEYYSRTYCWNLIEALERDNFELNYYRKIKDCTVLNTLLENIVKSLQDAVPFHEAYSLVWKIRVFLITNTVLYRTHELEKNGEGDVSKDIIKIFAFEIANIIKEYVEKQQFYLTLLNEISLIVACSIEKLRFKDLDQSDVETLVTLELTNHKIVEIMLMCIKILPRRPSSKTIKEHEHVIKSFEMSEYDEVKAFFYEKKVKT